MKKQFLCLMGLGMATVFFAQEKETQVEEVQVFGKFLNLPLKKVNENVTVITKADLQTTPAQSVEEILAHFTGFDIRKRGANGVQADISLRGSSFEQVLILINGIRMNDSQTGHNSMSVPVDLSSIEKIEIVKGPAARRFGQNAYAGVINIVTKASSENTVTVSAAGGDFETYSMGLDSQFGNERISNFVQASTSSSGGYRYNTDYKIHNIFYQNHLRLQNGNLRFQAGIQEKKFGANGFYATAAARDQYEETQASVVSVAADQQWNQFRMQGNMYWRRGQDMYEYVRNKPEIYRNMHIGNNVGGELNGSYTSALGTTGLGVELRKEYLSSNNLGDRERFLTQAFFEHYFSLFSDRLSISPGISWSRYDDHGDFFYPGIDVGFSITDAHKIFGSAAKVNRIPTFTDLYYSSPSETGNPNLLPENALSAEAGYRFQKGGFTGKITGFGRFTHDAIDWIKADAAEPWQAVNIGKINTKGFEAELEQRFQSVVEKIALGYTFLESKAEHNPALMSRYVMENLKHQVVAKMENRWTKNMTSQLVYRYLERVSTGNHQLLDVAVHYHLNQLKLYVLVNNVTDAQYTETFGVPMPGRWFHIGASYRIKL